MNIPEQIENYLQSLTESQNLEMKTLHQRIQNLLPHAQLWFLDGKDEKGKVVSNPNIGYGLQKIQYANGKTKDFYQIGISANTRGISVYIMGLPDKNYLSQSFENQMGKAKITGYCIQFKQLSDIHLDVLDQAILEGVALTNSQ